VTEIDFLVSYRMKLRK